SPTQVRRVCGPEQIVPVSHDCTSWKNSLVCAAGAPTAARDGGQLGKGSETQAPRSERHARPSKRSMPELREIEPSPKRAPALVAANPFTNGVDADCCTRRRRCGCRLLTCRASCAWTRAVARKDRLWGCNQEQRAVLIDATTHIPSPRKVGGTRQ